MSFVITLDRIQKINDIDYIDRINSYNKDDDDDISHVQKWDLLWKKGSNNYFGQTIGRGRTRRTQSHIYIYLM